MEFTGERMIPEHNDDGEIYLEHMARYLFASQFVRGKDVLDIACGSGYGSRMLTESGANRVVGVDISEEAITYCRENYADSRAEFIVGGVDSIPLPDQSVDAVVSFETIEHVDAATQGMFLREVERVLKPEGIFVASTPNTVVSPEGNPFHLKELTPSEFRDLLGEHFPCIKLLYQKNVEASFIMTEEQMGAVASVGGLEINRLHAEDKETAYFLIAVCSRDEMTAGEIRSRMDIFGDEERQRMLRDREEKLKLIRECEKLVETKDALVRKSEELVIERDAYIRELEARMAAK